jgi:hypothetical protein
MTVMNSTSGEPISNVDVSLKYDFDYYVPKPDEWNEWKRATYKWYSSTTNVGGEATVDIIETGLDRTIGPTPPSWLDDVTGTSYLISVKKDQVREEHRLIMRPGASVRGEVFTVHVLEIQRPRYIRADTSGLRR